METPSFKLLDRLEYELRQLWHRYIITKDPTLLMAYRAKYKAYKSTKDRLYGT